MGFIISFEIIPSCEYCWFSLNVHFKHVIAVIPLDSQEFYKCINNFADFLLNYLSSIIEKYFIADYSKSKNLANRVIYITMKLYNVSLVAHVGLVAHVTHGSSLNLFGGTFI